MTKAEKDHKAALVELGCMACRRIYGPHEPGPVTLHHKRGGMGGWGKGDYRTLIPLCDCHHQGEEGVHTLGTKGFVKYHGFSEDELLTDALELLEGRG